MASIELDLLKIKEKQEFISRSVGADDDLDGSDGFALSRVLMGESLAFGALDKQLNGKQSVLFLQDKIVAKLSSTEGEKFSPGKIKYKRITKVLGDSVDIEALKHLPISPSQAKRINNRFKMYKKRMDDLVEDGDIEGENILRLKVAAINELDGSINHDQKLLYRYLNGGSYDVFSSLHSQYDDIEDLDDIISELDDIAQELSGLDKQGAAEESDSESDSRAMRRAIRQAKRLLKRLRKDEKIANREKAKQKKRKKNKEKQERNERRLAKAERKNKIKGKFNKACQWDEDYEAANSKQVKGRTSEIDLLSDISLYRGDGMCQCNLQGASNQTLSGAMRLSSKASSRTSKSISSNDNTFYQNNRMILICAFSVLATMLLAVLLHIRGRAR